MSPTRSLLTAGGLTAVVVVAVLVAGIGAGTFGLGADQPAVTLPAENSDLTQDPTAPPTTLSSNQTANRDDDHDDDDDKDRDDDRRSRLATTGDRSGSRITFRSDHDDD